jgi:polysaccharide biosynthesis protein PelE
MSQLKLALYALLLELSAGLQLFFSHSHSDLQFISFMITHALACAVLASLALLTVPGRLARPRRHTWLFFFFASTSVPLLGFVGVLAGLFLLPLLPRPKDPVDFKELGLPELDPHERRDATAFRQAGLRNFLRNDRAPADLRLKALVALQNAPVQYASPVLRDLLTDPSDDLRLLAYGMLEAREKRLNADIHAARMAWQDALDDVARRAAAKRLAGYYWELIYQGLVQGDLRTHAAEQALSFLEQTLDGETDAGMHLRYGRLLHETRRYDEALLAYRRAVELGLPAPRVLPYLAELAFMRREFGEVIELLGTLRSYPDQARLQPLLRFWRVA